MVCRDHLCLCRRKIESEFVGEAVAISLWHLVCRKHRKWISLHILDMFSIRRYRGIPILIYLSCVVCTRCALSKKTLQRRLKWKRDPITSFSGHFVTQMRRSIIPSYFMHCRSVLDGTCTRATFIIPKLAETVQDGRWHVDGFAAGISFFPSPPQSIRRRNESSHSSRNLRKNASNRLFTFDNIFRDSL